jgi:hypothetical protein
LDKRFLYKSLGIFFTKSFITTNRAVLMIFAARKMCFKRNALIY